MHSLKETHLDSLKVKLTVRQKEMPTDSKMSLDFETGTPMDSQMG